MAHHSLERSHLENFSPAVRTIPSQGGPPILHPVLGNFAAFKRHLLALFDAVELVGSVTVTSARCFTELALLSALIMETMVAGGTDVLVLRSH